MYEFESDLRREGSDDYPRYKPSNIQAGLRDTAVPNISSEDGDRTIHDTVYSTEAVRDFEAFLASKAPRGASLVFAAKPTATFGCSLKLSGVGSILRASKRRSLVYSSRDTAAVSWRVQPPRNTQVLKFC